MQVLSSLQRILVRGVNWLGDAVMTTPALQRLREAAPDADIVLLAPDKLADLWLHHPSIDGVLTFSAGEGVLAVGRRLRKERFELALILPNSPRSALECWFAGIPHRVGYRRRWRNLFLTRAIPHASQRLEMHKRSVAEVGRRIATPGMHRETYPESAHHLFHYLHLVGALGASRMPITPFLRVTGSELRDVQARFGIGLSGRMLLGLNPGAEYGPAKRWPAERFLSAALAIRKVLHNDWVIFGGAKDQIVASQIAAGLRAEAAGGSGAVHDLSGRTSLRELCALLSGCSALLTNDTGPMHLAAALGVSVVVPFGSTAPGLTGPGLPGEEKHHLLEVDVACAPCFRRECPIDFRCMERLDVAQVVEAMVAAAGIGRK